MVIWFNSERALKHLLENKRVYSIRKQRKQFGVTTLNHNKKLMGTVRVSPVLEMNVTTIENLIQQLDQYVNESGFEDSNQWINEIKKLNRNWHIPSYLILIRVDLIKVV